jgi:hypothetical protein
MRPVMMDVAFPDALSIAAILAVAMIDTFPVRRWEACDGECTDRV